MWFQVELQNPQTITELQFQSPPGAERGAAVARRRRADKYTTPVRAFLAVFVSRFRWMEIHGNRWRRLRAPGR
jgi:hypothetical protein